MHKSRHWSKAINACFTNSAGDSSSRPRGPRDTHLSVLDLVKRRTQVEPLSNLAALALGKGVDAAVLFRERWAGKQI